MTEYYEVRVSDDKELVDEIRQKLKENGGYCPCRVEKTEWTKCPCHDFKTSDKVGPCHCGLFVRMKVDKK